MFYNPADLIVHIQPEGSLQILGVKMTGNPTFSISVTPLLEKNLPHIALCWASVSCSGQETQFALPNMFVTQLAVDPGFGFSIRFQMNLSKSMVVRI